MKNLENNAVTAVVALCLLFFISFSAPAQKLPKVQVNSLPAPDNIRVDGKTNEWGDKYQAYNNSTDVFYTIANDNEKLYLVLKVTDKAIISKIIAGGITFVVSPRGKKNQKDQFAITFPVYDQNNKPDIDILNNPEILKQESKAEVGSAVAQANKKLIGSSKEIKITGTKIITDTLISVYNDAGIRVAARFNSAGDYIYELALPIKYLNLSTDAPDKFSYNVKLNEPVNAPVITANTSTKLAPPAPVKDIDVFQTTDFWGAYILARK